MSKNSFYPDRQYIVVLDDKTPSSVSGSGPSYSVNYGMADMSAAKEGMYVLVDSREAGAGTGSTVLSTYAYIITGVNASVMPATFTLTYVGDTAGDGDDSPADLYSGGGSSGSPATATHDIVMYLGPAFEMFVE
jgi:hypothetical protein